MAQGATVGQGAQTTAWRAPQRNVSKSHENVFAICCGAADVDAVAEASLPRTETEAAAAEVLACGQGWEQAKIVAAFKWIAARRAEMKANERPWSAEANAKAKAKARAKAEAEAAEAADEAVANAAADAEEDEGTATADATDMAIAQAQCLSRLDSVCIYTA